MEMVNDDDEEMNGWMEARLPKLGAPHSFSYQSVKTLGKESVLALEQAHSHT